MTEQILSKRNTTLVFVPTYNELENARELCGEILKLPIQTDILFLDDNSPDGTGQMLDNMANIHPNVKVIHRSGKLGVGSAHFDGIQYAYDHGYTELVTMDCDFTHPPHYIPQILKSDPNYDIVVGSRYLQEKSLTGWSLIRKFLTQTGHFLTLHLLGMKYDATGGFRLYRLNKIPRYAFNLVRSRGYSFFFESLYILHFNAYKIAELPIVLPPRTYGHSKMSYREIGRSVRLLLSLHATTVLNRESLIVCEPFVKDGDKVGADKQGWDNYWNDQKSDGRLLYGLIAAFYRKFIIKKNLNHFIKKYFQPNANLLHAGCGSGQVDLDIRHYASITGMDISVNALNFYRRTNQKFCKTLHGSIFEIPLKKESVDGIYNLGVMEHFTDSEIKTILTQFYTVLKPQGRMVIFWPPEFGTSVNFLKGVKWTLETVFKKKNVTLHPDEITRVQSKRHVLQIFESSGFKVLEYYFGIKDLFTYSIIVLEKPAKAWSHSEINPTNPQQVMSQIMAPLT